MASHGEINPSDLDLLLGTGLNALEVATGLLTRRSGGVWIDTGDGSGILAGGNASDGINRVDKDGVQLPLVDTSGIDKAAKDAQQKADEAIAKGEQIRQDAQAGIDDVRSDLESQTTALKSSISAVDAKANQVKAAADKISQRVDADKAALDKSIADVGAKAQAASDKGDKLAGQIGDVTTTVNGHTTKLDALSTRIEGVASDGQATTKSLTSLRQTVTGLSSTVSQSTKTASDAMSKATQVEQTANGISANLSKNYTSTAESDKKYAAKTELKTTAEGLQANITKSQQTADGAVTAASKAQATADGINATLSKDYQTAKDSDAKYSTKAELKVTSNELSSSLSSVRQMADGAVTAASKAQQTADGISANLSKNYATKSDNDATYATQTSLKATSDSLAASINSNAKTAQGAVDKATNLEANLNGFKTTVSQTYGRGSNLWVNPMFDADKPLIGSLASDIKAPNGANVCLLAYRDNLPDFKTAFPVVPGNQYRMTAMCKRLKGDLALHAGIWYTAQIGGASFDTYVKPSASSDLGDGWIAYTWDFTCAVNKSAGVVYFQIDNRPPDSGSTQWLVANVTCTDVTGLQPAGDYATNSSLSQTANQIRGEVSEKYQSKNGMSSYATNSALTQKADEITGKVTEVAKTAQGNTTTISQVSQKVDRINTTLSQQIGGKAATSRVSSLEQNLDGFKSSVAKTYQTKGDYPSKAEVQSRIDQSASSIKSTVSQTYTTLDATEALRKSATRMFTLYGSNGTGPKWIKLGYLTSNGDSSSVILHVYSGDGFNGAAHQNAEFEIFVKDGHQGHPSASGAFGVSVQRVRNADAVRVKVLAFDDRNCDIWAYLPWWWWSGHYTLQGDYEAWQDGPNCGGVRILDSEPTNGVAQDLAYDTLSTRSYVDQTSRSVALGVVQNYKGADGSGLATKSDITATANGITSTVSSTYATKSGVTQEISSKITQNNASLDVRFATKAENQTVRDAANTAKSDASDARSRVGTLEDCISLTSDGVQVGKRSNGVFTGTSTLVGTDGAFHVRSHASTGAVEDVAKLGHDLLVVKSTLKLSDGSHLDRLTAGAYGDNHFAIRMNPAAAVFNNHESVQIWQTGWQIITTGNGCEGYASYGYRGGCLRFRGRVRTTVNGDNSLFADPDLLDLATTPVNRNFILPAYRNGTLGWTNTYVPANSRQVKIFGVWDWVSLDQLSIAQ